MGEFRFRRFTVSNERSAMKVNTDGVLLGASATLLSGDSCLLDVGTGTGTIALMAAQRLADLKCDVTAGEESHTHGERHGDFRIIGIDIDKDSADEAAMNFSASPWASCLRPVNISLSGYTSACRSGGSMDGFSPDMRFDAILSNPPYFESSLKAPDERRRNARHADTLSYRDIFSVAGSLLKNTGRISLILPAEQETDAVRDAAASGFYPFRIISVRTVPRKAPSRVIMEFSRFRETVTREELTIQEKGTYTEQYRSLVKDFLLI